ncbi:MAG: zinc-binding dehydrogenase [Desulfobacteraceae bacterium]|nr:zinc-binding dehydrogenase [Desulfobacteraceae bacterium]
MKAAIFHKPFHMTTEEVEMPEIGGDEILLNIKACGICGSDLHMYKLDLHTDKLCRKTSKGKIPGHEFAGDVVKVGKNVQDIQVGDKVAGATSGGGFAEYNPVMVYPGINVFKIPPGVSYEEAATLEPLANSLHATLKGKPADGENVVVFGAGIIGLGIVQCLRALDIKLNKLIVVDVSDGRLAMAKKLGADEVINPTQTPLDDKIREIVGWAPLMSYAEESTAQVDVVYDCVGYIKERPEPPVLQQAIEMVKELTGRIVVHGLFEANISLELSYFVVKQIDIIGSYAFFPDEVAQAMALIGSGKVDRKPIITHSFPLDQAKEAFDMQCDVNHSVKVMITP